MMDKVEIVARAMLDGMEDHGGIDYFLEKLRDFPEQYLSELASIAVATLDDVAGVKESLSTEVQHG